jgi:Ca-activated chloride channel family protein
MSQDWSGLQTGNIKPEVQKEITQLGLSYKLMTQFTSFVAVEERVVTTNGKPTRVEVPVEMPEGVSYEGIFGNEGDKLAATNGRSFLYSAGAIGGANHGAFKKVLPQVATPAAGIASGSGGGIAPSIGGPIPAPPPPTATVTTKLQMQPEPSPMLNAPPNDRALLESKLTPAVLERFDCWKKQASECKLAPDGTADVQLFLSENSAAVIDQLKALGLQISQIRKRERLVIARVPIDKLTDVANLQQIKFVSEPRR